MVTQKSPKDVDEGDLEDVPREIRGGNTDVTREVSFRQ